jgi:hypothetical protein
MVSIATKRDAVMNTIERKSAATPELQLLRYIVAKLVEIEAQLKSPLTARQLHLRFCVGCGTRVTNKNVGGFTGRSALTGRLFCLDCADEIGDAQS